MTETWFTSDWHINATDEIPEDIRPPDVVGLVELHNAVVDPDDTVWMLGNICRGPLEESLPWISKLHGRKYLVAGSHDPVFAGNCSDHMRRAELVGEYIRAGFRRVVTGHAIGVSGMAPTLPLRTWHGGTVRETVALSHFPPANLASIAAGDPNHRDTRWWPQYRPRKLNKSQVPANIRLDGYRPPEWTIHGGLRPEYATGQLPHCFNVTPGPHGWLPVHVDQILAVIDSERGSTS